MNSLWIIGNGFDVNLGLLTGYGDFLHRAYFVDEGVSEEREKLIEHAGCPLGASNRWSDLEALLGEMSGAYEREEIELFHETFEHMESLMLDYVESEQELVDESSITDECRAEFASSVMGFHMRLRPADRNRFYGNISCSDGCHHEFISLNYTDLLDRMVSQATQDNGLIGAHAGSNGSNYDDFAATPKHLHGALSENREVVFGVSDESQLSSWAENDEDFCNLWVKQRRNFNEFKNLRTSNAFRLIGNADSICLFGVSLGKTDNYLWEQVGKRLSGSKACLVFYAHGYIDGIATRKNQMERHKIEKRLKEAFGWDDNQYAAVRDRVFIEPSSRVFRCKLSINREQE